MMSVMEKVTFNYKAVLIVASLILMSASSLAVAERRDNSNQIVMNYSFEQPIIEKINIENTIYDEVVLPGVSSTGNPGEPCLPIKGSYILLPQGSTVDSITITTSEKMCLGDGFFVKPVGEIVPLSKRDSVSLPTPDEKIYSSSNEFPGDLFTEVGVYWFRGYKILVLDLYPVQYIPTSGELFYYTDMTVSIKLSIDGTINPLYRGFEKDRLEVINKVDNPKAVTTYTQPDMHPVDSYDLLILTTDGLKDGFETLKNAHDYEGITTVIKTLSDVGGSTPEDIREYIGDAYTDWGIDYVLIGGDDGVVPAKILWVYGLDEGTTPYSTYMPSDLYYGCLDGPYNYDGDNKWGEPTDGEGGGDVDLFAEVYVGRACVDNLADVNNFVTKTVSYINEDPEDEYFKQVCLAGEYLGNYGVSSWGGNHLDQLIDGCSDDGYTTVGIPSDEYTINILYDREWPGNNWPKSEIMNIISNNVLVVNHDGHAYYGYNLKMDISDVDDLTNDKYCFIYSHGCMSGGFDNPDGYDCIAEHFTVKTENAAFAVIMNARYGWFWSYSTDGDSQRFNREFWDAVFDEDMPEIGRANQDSKEDNLHIIGRSCIRWCYYQLNLLGDPSLAFFKDPHAHPDIEIGDVTGGFGVETMIKNTGDADATGVEWTITVTGGIFDLINKTFSGTIPELVVDEEATVNSDIFLGLGKINITITAECNEGSFTDGTAEGTQLLFFTKIEE
jgi:hypothetical protein